MDIIDKIKSILRDDPPELVEGTPIAQDIVKAMSDKDLRKYYMGKDPQIVPREAQEELYLRFVQPHADPLCKECYGRGHNGWLKQLHQLQPCSCLQRQIRKKLTKENQAVLYDPDGNLVNFMN